MSRKPRAGAIIRVSRRNRKDGSGHSPEVQRRLDVRFAESQGWELLPENIRDENDIRDGDVSGGADLSERPGFGPLVELVRARELDIILTADFSRFFRDLDIQRQVIAQIEEAGGQLWTVSNGRISHETAESELTANLQGSVTHYQKRYARDKSFLAVEIAIENGSIPWRTTAPGYLRRDIDGVNSRLIPDPARRDVIARAFEHRAAGMTILGVRAFLAEHGIRRSYRGVQRLLRNRIYLGEIHHGTHTPNLAAHEAIVDRATFEAVRAMVVDRGAPPKSDRLLARLGVLRCATCGSTMNASAQTHRQTRYPFYRCAGTYRDCSHAASISARAVEERVIDEVKAAVGRRRGRASAGAELDAVESELLAVDSQLETTAAAFDAAGLDDVAGAVENLRGLRERRDHLRGRRVELLALCDVESVGVEIFDDPDPAALPAKRDLIRATLRSVTVTPGKGRFDERVAVDPRE
jgi:site-specific DNA recombinase